jgi:hypothetical protein
MACSGQGLAEGVASLPQSELDAVGEARVSTNLVAFDQLSVDRPPNVNNEQRATYPDMSGVIVSKTIRLVLAFKAGKGLRQLAQRPADRPRVVEGQVHRLYLPPSYVRSG